jgi:hypothetical protein
MTPMPGMDILQQWMQSARGTMPGFQAWASPTLDPEEIGKRIEQLRTVQFWLEQNAKLIGTSIQALEVQRMTLSTLKSLKVPMADLSAAFRLPTEAAPAEPERPAARAAAPKPAPQPEPPPTEPPAEAPTPSAPLADPVQWWGQLTQQFAALASQAVKDGAAAAQAAAQAAQPDVAAPAAPASARSPRRAPAQPRTSRAAGTGSAKSSGSRSRR